MNTKAQAAQTKHTPGPWEIFWNYGSTEQHRIYTGHGAEPCEIIARVEAYAPTPEPSEDPELQGKANARLIAAAPELLEALEVAANELTRLIERGNDSSRLTLATVCKAIAKARG